MTLNHDDCCPHFTDGQIESLRAEISYMDHTGSKWLKLANLDPNLSSKLQIF